MQNRNEFANARRVVVKIGSALLTRGGQGLDIAGITGWVAQIAAAQRQGIAITLVSSGSVAEGMSRLGWKTRPHALH